MLQTVRYNANLKLHRIQVDNIKDKNLGFTFKFGRITFTYFEYFTYYD